MKKLTLTETQVSEVLNKLTPSWVGCINAVDLERAQVAKSQTRNWLFGTIINQKFIKLNKNFATFKAGELVSIADIYDTDSAQSLAGLIIYRLAHSGLVKAPSIVGV
jgi:hypothetical protein